MKKSVKKVLSHFKNVKKVGKNKYKGKCPSHDDKKSSLSITIKNKKILLYCHAGCKSKDILLEIGLKFSDLFLKNKKINVSHTTSNSPQHRNGGCSLRQYSRYKKIPEEFLKSLGLRDSRYAQSTSLVIPYLDEHGNEMCRRYRTNLAGDDKFHWDKGTKVMLYGLWKLKEAKEKGYVVLVEGESDCHTLWFKRIPAIGLPGASNWRDDRDAKYFQGFKTVYSVLEPDQGGETVKQSLKNSSLADRVKIIPLGKYKDPSEMYLANPKKFKKGFKKLLLSAIPLNELLSEEAIKARKEAWKLCESIARNQDILDLFAKHLAKDWVAGERKLAKVLYLALITRLFEKPVPILIKADSSAGKSFILLKVLKYFPQTAYYSLTSSSKKALIFADESYKNRFVVFYEAAGINSPDLDYTIRTLLSEGRLRYLVAEPNKDGQFKSRLIEKEGPTGLITTTTKKHLNPENETRYLAFTSNQTIKQTGRICELIGNKFASEQKNVSKDMSEWHAFQDWLQLGKSQVIVPYAPVLGKLINPRALRMRRDIEKILTLIMAQALIHRRSRELTPKGSIVAKIRDYSAVYKLVKDSLSFGVHAVVPSSIRETVNAVKELIEGKNGPNKTVSIKKLAKKLNLNKSNASRISGKAIEEGYLKNLETKKGVPAKLVLDKPIPDFREVLPKPSILREKYRAYKKRGGIENP